MIEIERKFLVKSDKYRSDAFKVKLLSQAYLNNNPEKSVRIRIIDNKGFITIKGPSCDGGMSRFEWEKKISIEEAVELMKLCGDKIIFKKRYLGFETFFKIFGVKTSEDNDPSQEYIQGDLFTPREELRKVDIKWSSPKQVLELLGETPLPKYIKRKPDEDDKETQRIIIEQRENKKSLAIKSNLSSVPVTI